MNLKRDKVYELMRKYCENNYNLFARTLGVDPTHLHRAMTKGKYEGARIIGAIMKFCKDNDLDFEDYIDLDFKPTKGKGKKKNPPEEET